MENLIKNTELRAELLGHILDRVNDGVIDDDNKEDWHFHCFNEDHYIIGYYESSEWLKKYGLGELEAAEMCREYEKDNFGEVGGEYDNTEKVVNMLAYILGELIMGEIDADDIEELSNEINEEIG